MEPFTYGGLLEPWPRDSTRKGRMQAHWDMVGAAIVLSRLLGRYQAADDDILQAFGCHLRQSRSTKHHGLQTK